MRIRKQFTFEAAHWLPHHPGKCARPHGHSYLLDVAVDGPLHAAGPAAGMVEDFDTIAEVVMRDVIENPTSELIALWIWERLAPALANLTEVVVWETATACAIVRAADVMDATRRT